MRIVIALGGNALLRRGQSLSADNQIANIRRAVTQLALVADTNDVLLTHGNGPQVGLLALQSLSYTAVQPYPLDQLGAQTEGMIGYLLERELRNLMPSRAIATLVTCVEVDMADAAFLAPSKPIGPMYSAEEAPQIAQQHAWAMALDGTGSRRVVPSPSPQRIFALKAIELLLSNGVLVIAAGGGGIPVTAMNDGKGFCGVEAVIDKDASSSMLAQALNADCLVIATDVDAVYLDFGQATQRPVHSASPAALNEIVFPAGSMRPKIEAACSFVKATGKRAVIGSLDNIEAMLRGDAGTQIRVDGTLAL